MKRITVLFMLIASFGIFCVFAASAETGIIEFRYRLNKFIAEDIELTFTDAAGNEENEHAVDTGADLDYTQVQLRIRTNKTAPYTLSLTFTPMRYADGSQPTYYWLYRARVFDIYDNPSFRNVVFTSSDNVTVSFPGDNSNNARTVITHSYPISFDFSDYIEDYPAGTFSANVTVEVETQ